MELYSFIWTGFAAFSGNTATAPVMPAQAVTVQTNRSDGAIFPAVTQTQRQQKQRRVRVSGSTQALPSRPAPTAVEEPPKGGVFVTPAGDVDTATPQLQGPIIAIPQIFPPNILPSHPRKR